MDKCLDSLLLVNNNEKSISKVINITIKIAVEL